MAVILHAHPVRGESHIQRNTTGEVATAALFEFTPCEKKKGKNVPLGWKNNLMFYCSKTGVSKMQLF